MEGSRPIKKMRIDPSDPSASEEPQSSQKTKACTKFFSVSGCPYWSKCNFLHALPPGMNSFPTAMSNIMDETKRKTKLCNKFNSPEGCPFGDKCNFAHGDKDLQPQRSQGMQFCQRSAAIPNQGMFGNAGRRDPQVEGVGAATATATMPVRADAVGAVIGKGGCNIKNIFAQSGASVKFTGTDDAEATHRTLEMVGTLEQIQVAQQMVQSYVSMFNTSGGGKSQDMAKNKANFKTKLCENWSKTGNCTYGSRCHFAHGEDELRAATEGLQGSRASQMPQGTNVQT